MGAILEAYTLDEAMFKEILSDPEPRFESLKSALQEVFGESEENTLKSKFLDGLYHRMNANPSEDSLLSIVAVVRTIGKHIGGYSVNSVVVSNLSK